MRVGIVALLQESNTFLPEKTTLRHFEENLLCEGEAVRQKLAGSHHEVAGFFEGLEQNGIEAVPIFAARAIPFGVIVAEAFETLVSRLLEAVSRSGQLDGLLVAPHGATVAENAPDADGYWLTKLRRQVGDQMSIVGTLDLHTNLSADMVQACNALIGYRTNPHLDQKQRGLDAANLMAKTLRGEITPHMAAHLLPLVVNIERQATSEPHCKRLYDLADSQLSQGTLANSLILGFPYADVSEMGASVIAVANSQAEASQAADELGHAWWNSRTQFVGELIDVDTALTMASETAGPVCLLDMGDNVGGGSPGDGTLVLHGLLKHQLLPAFAVIYDPQSQRLAREAGVGRTLELTVGGKTDTLHGTPITANFQVVNLTDGTFQESAPRHGGYTDFNQGPTAVVRTDNGLTLMLTDRRMAPVSLSQLLHAGLDPSQFRAIVAKGVHAPVAAYEPVCTKLIRVDTPGATSADFHRLEYHKRRQPLFPFESETEWQPDATRLFGHTHQR